MTGAANHKHLKAAALGIGFGMVAMLVTDVIADALWLFLPLALLAVAAVIIRARRGGPDAPASGPARNRHRLQILPWLRLPSFWLGVFACLAFGVWQAWCLTCERLLMVLTEVQP